MRKYAVPLKIKKFSLKYYFSNKKIQIFLTNKIIDFIKSKKISDVKMFEIEDKFLKKELLIFVNSTN